LWEPRGDKSNWMKPVCETTRGRSPRALIFHNTIKSMLLSISSTIIIITYLQWNQEQSNIKLTSACIFVRTTRRHDTLSGCKISSSFSQTNNSMLISIQTLVNFALFGSWVEMLYTYLELLLSAMCFEDIFCKFVQFTSSNIHLHQWRPKKRTRTHNSLRSTARPASIIPHFSRLIRCRADSTHMRSRLNQISR